MIKTFLRSIVFASSRLIVILSFIGLLGGLKADVVADDPGLDAVVRICGAVIRIVFRLLRTDPDGCCLGLIVLVLRHAFLVTPTIWRQAEAFDRSRAEARERQRRKAATGRPPKKKGR